MAKKVEITIEEKLRALFDLQLIDSRIDEIRNIRGELPLEVEDLEDLTIIYYSYLFVLHKQEKNYLDLLD